MSDNLIINTKNKVCTVTLNRPEKHNAFDNELVNSLIVALKNINTDKNIRIVVVTGAGISFSAGADLNWMRSMADFDEKKNISDALQVAELMHSLYMLDKVSIAKVNGSAFGGGLGLIACCDFSIAAANSVFGFTEVKLGLAPAVISPYIVNAIGQRRTNQLFLSGETFDSFDAIEYGIIDEAVEATQLDNTVNTYARQLLLGGPEAQKTVKKLTRKLDTIPENIQQYTAELIAKVRTSPEGQHGMKAFLDKQKPQWQK